MSEMCSHCSVVSRNACSEYSGRALEAELRNCPNLSPRRRLQEAGTDQDLELLRLQDENEELRAQLSATKPRRPV